MDPLDRHFRDSLADLSEPSGRYSDQLSSDKSAWWWGLFEAQATSRHLDFVARELQREGRGFYTIGSAGHESNAMVAMALRTSDPALLHYRSGGVLRRPSPSGAGIDASPRRAAGADGAGG